MTIEAATVTVNRMPAITWHKFKINEAEVSFSAMEEAGGGAIEAIVPAGIVEDSSAFDAALSSAEGAASQWETGMGEVAHGIFSNVAARHIGVVAPAGTTCEEPVVVRVNAEDGACALALLDVVAQAHSRIHVAVHVDSPLGGTGVAGVETRVFAAEGANVDIEFVQTLDATWQHLDNFGAHLEDGARLNASQTVLGAAESYTGFACNLSGRESEAVVETRYLGHGANKIDFNYIMRQRGVQSTCTLSANGVLMDSSAKVLRGTIDLVHGAKGAIGQENETVLLVSDDVSNKTVPILLCDEDDVQGAHGATIGHVNPEQLGYMQTRGLTPDQTEDLFAVAAFDYARLHAFDDAVRAAVERLGGEVLGDAYRLLQDED
ncbi:MAG: SufD family Fe-S cluster assembly protein [Eggerthellaceae bacterium]|nr:SufD family Fe-S cluster assembly protein [Eggerthellaceae bacterium]